MTWLDITHAVGVASRFMQKPKKSHLIVVRQIMRYVNSIIDYRIFHKKGVSCKVTRYCDADLWPWHLSFNNWIYVYLGIRSSISCYNKRQSTVSLLSTKTEYRAIAMATQECMWLIQLLQDLHQSFDYAVELYCDN